MHTVVIPRADWRVTLDEFSMAHEGWRMSLDVLTPELGAQPEIADNSVLRKRVAVVMQRRAIENRWQSEVWEPLGVLSDYAGPSEPRVLVEDAGMKQWLYPAFEIVLRLSEAEGYYHNVSSKEPHP